MKNYVMPYRQIHLDFHTSPLIEGIGEDFNAKEFAQTLKKANVNSINLFAKCHHGMYYYPTKLGTVHPYLKNGLDLFGEQLKACREEGIRVLAYTTVMWNEDWVDRHPEWQVIGYDGLSGAMSPFYKGPTRWRSLCTNNPDYKAMLKEEFTEIMELYDVLGYWVDIVFGKRCVCAHCQKSMKEKGLNPESLNDVIKHDRMVEIAFCKEFYEYVKTLGEDKEVYFNGHPYELDNGQDNELSSVEKRKHFSFIDIESLPSDVWGYAHYPVAVNYLNHREQDITMMNGKFHVCWGDFGSLRNIEALEYETFRAIANGSCVCVGDQLHPRGKLDTVVYNRIGDVFASIKDKEPWLIGSKKMADVAAVIPAKPLSGSPEKGDLICEAVYRVLSELHIQFDFVNFDDDLSKYKLVILPDEVRPDAEFAKKIDAYVKQGGKILATGKSGVAENADTFAITSIPAVYEGSSEWDTRYIRLKDGIFSDVPAIDNVVYEKGEKVKAATGAKVLASYVNPYFNRNYDAYCSHRQTPPTLQDSSEPAIMANDNCVYISSPFFSDYVINGYKPYRDILEACIRLLYAKPLVKTDLPSISEVTVRSFDDSVVAHIINYVIQRKFRKFDTIEARYTVCNKFISVKTGFKPSKVLLVPEQKEVNFEYDGEYVKVPIDYAEGHTMFSICK